MMDSAALVLPPHASPPLYVEDSLLPGTEVTVEGLAKAPHFNGLHGVVQRLDAETGRYDVLLCSPILPRGQQLAKVKRANLRVSMSLSGDNHLPVCRSTWADEWEEEG